MKIAKSTLLRYPVDRNFDEIALSRTVKEIEPNLCFAIFGKNSKIQNGRHFGGGEHFLKIAKSTFLRYPVGRKLQCLFNTKSVNRHQTRKPNNFKVKFCKSKIK